MSEHGLFNQANEEWDAGHVKRAFELFMKAAQQGDRYALNSIGYFYDHGIAVRRNTAKALFWYLKALRSGDRIAYANIGTVYRDRRHFERARFWFLQAIRVGDDGDAALKLAKLHLARRSQLDLAQAAKYLRLALKFANITGASIVEAKRLLGRV